MNCKICASSNAPVTFLISGGRVPVRRCRECGFTYVQHRVDEMHLETSEHNLSGVLETYPGNRQKWELRLRLLESLAGPVRGQRILDVGAGGGGWLARARNAGAVVEGVEFCSTCRSYARTEFQLELRTEPLEMEYWRSRAGAFDLVTFWDVLEHVNDPLAFLADCRRLLATGGRLMFSTPVRDTWFDRAGESLNRLSFGRSDFLLQQRYSHAHLQIFHSTQLRRILEDSGARLLYYRKIHELTFPVERYFRNMYGDRPILKPLARSAEALLHTLPLANKVLGIAVFTG